jgi:KDO2-lipid IV(A) lauroyltransferase
LDRAFDLREGEQWTLAQRAKNDAVYFLAAAVLACVSRLPAGALRALGRALGAAAHALVPSARRLALENVARAFPERDDHRALVRRVYRSLGAHLGDAVAMLDADRPLALLPFESGSRECLEEAWDGGRRGVLFSSAHLGAWERLAASLVAAGFPLTVVAREAYDPRFTRLYERLRGGRSVRAIYRGAPGAAAGLLRTLRRGGILGIPMDLASRVPSIDAPFLGHAAKTAVGPARLALRTGAAVVVGTPTPDGTIRVSRIATIGDELSLTTRINDELSSRIRAMPEEWVWMHARFERASRRRQGD